jgi:hypothetical protein
MAASPRGPSCMTRKRSGGEKVRVRNIAEAILGNVYFSVEVSNVRQQQDKGGKRNRHVKKRITKR